MVGSVGITKSLATGNYDETAQKIDEAARYQVANPGSKEGNELMAAWQRGNEKPVDGESVTDQIARTARNTKTGAANVAGEFAKDWNEAPGVVSGIRETAKNVGAMGAGVVEQVPNMLLPMAGMLAGGAAGGAAGSSVPVVGNVVGTGVGAWLGASAGNTLVEGGGMAQEALQKAGINPSDKAAVKAYFEKNGDALLAQAGIKGGIIGAVDTATMGIASKLLTAPGKAAAGRAMADMGVDVTDNVAVKAAMQSPELAARVASDPAYRAATTGAQGLARNTGVAALEPAGEFTGELVGQGVATGDWDVQNAALEAASSIGQSGATFAGQKAYAGIKYPFKANADQAAQLPDTGPMSRSANLAISTGAAADAASVLGVPADAEQAGEQIAPKSMDSIGRVQQIDQQMQSAAPEDAAAMKAERDQITAEWPQAVSGAPTSFSTESGARIDGNYALMEAHQLVTSHDEKLKPNPAYPREMQPRERDRAASEMQISSIVQRLDPARLGESGDAGTGAPIVGADGLVESGNARTIALKRAYQGNPEKAEAYRQYLSDNAARFGIAPESVAAMNTPVLVRVRNTPVDRAEFARQANASTVAQMSSSEQARSDAARIDDMGDLRPDDNGDFATSRDFIRRFVSRLPSTEQGGMVDSTGQLSQAGYARVRNAVLAKAYGESPVLARMVESLDDNMRNIGKALMRSAPEIAKLRQDVSEGALFDADVTPDLLAAVEEMSRIKDSGQSVAEYLSQGSLMGNATSPEAREMLKFLAVNMRRPGKIVEFIRNYTEALRAAGNPNQGSLLGEVAAPAKGEIINSALEKADGQAEAVSPTAGDSGKQGANQGANKGAENIGDKGAGRPAGEKPASTPGDRGGAQEGEVKATGKDRYGAGWSRRYYTIKRTDGSFALVRERTDEDGTTVEHLRQDGTWKKGKPPVTAAFGAHAEDYAPEVFASADEALKYARDDVSDSGGNVQGDETRLSRAPSNPKNVYRAYPLAASDREKLLKRFPPKYARVVADHLTAEGLRSMDKVIEGPATGAVIGESVGGGIQSLIVTVNGNETTADGTPFHITWSAEPGVSTGTAGESAKKHGFARLKSPIAIDLSGGPSISSPLRETRNEGETDKMFAKRVIDKREAPKTLPENHADYFLMDGATVVSIANLVSTKSEAENQQGGDNGAKRMAASAQGEISKRAPITVMPSKTEPGKYEVVDGNGTLTSVKKYGWKSLPVNVVERLAGHKITWADKYTDATKAVAASGGLMFNGQPYIITDTNIDVTHSFPDILKSGVAPEVLSRSGAFVAKHYSKKPDAPVSASDRVRAEEMLKPKLELASQAKNGYDQMVLDIAEATKSLGVMLADLKGIGRAATKLVNDEKFNVAGIKDLLRSTIVVGSFNDAQKVIEGIEKRFNVMRIKNRSMTDLHGHNLKNEDRMNFGGYADVLVNVILPNGTIGEIQINTPLMSAAKSGDGHKLYEIWRDLDEESDFAKETWAEMAEYYNAAFRSMNATLDLALFKKLASEIGAAPRGLPSISRSDTPESSSTNTLPSGKTTKSSPENEARNLQPGGNLSGTFISATSKDIVAEGEEKEYTEPVKGPKGAQNVDGNNGSPSAQGQEPGTVQGTVGQRGAASVRDGTGGRDQLVNRNADNGNVEQGQDGGKEPDGGSGATQGVRGDGQGNRAGRPAGVPAGRGAGEWVAFPPETGTLGIPRAEMPQVKNDIRPELFSFLKERGIHHETESVSAASLRPTQAEFSTAKAMNWVEVREGIDRFVLTSSDGFVLDGHHQWIAALAVGENVKAIQFNAPIDKLLAAVYAFPGTKRGEGAPGGQAQARQDFQAALADLGAIFRQINPGVRMLTPEEKVKLMPTLVKLFESGIKQVGYSMKDLIAHVKAAMKASADEFVKKHWNKIDEKTYREAAAQAIDNVQNAPQEVGQTADMFAIPKPGPAPVQGDMFAAMEKVAPEVFKKAAEPKAKPENPTETTKGVKNEQGKKAEVLTTPPAPKPSAPAGRDIPPKTGRNYAFGDDDLTYAGSWIQKATQNVEAVELLVKLDQEKRQATREEQAVLAKFIGWGASDLANSLFGDKLNKPLQEISEYEVALAAFDKIGRDYLRKGGNYRGDYGDSGYYSAVGVLRNAGKILGYGPTPERITKAEVIAAKPDMTAKKWNELRDRLKAVMSEEEWADAARSTQYAHYTSKPIVKSMMSALQRMGFKGGTILEPGAGIGVFPGLMPVDMANNSAYTGIEFDAITGRILKQLFPDERILVESFIDTALPQNYYDVAFGNPPFGNIPILADPKYRKYAFSLHDYFFAKTIDSVKPGGLVPFVTSRYTMDKLNDKARAYLAERADLVGAIRLPQTAFKKNAGTDVVTDVLFLRKKVPGETFEGGQSWAKSVPITINGRQFNINEYFHAHPEMVLGKNSDAGKMANSPDPQYTVEAIEGDIDTLFDKAAGTLPENIYRAVHDTAAEDAKVRDLDFNPKAKKEGNYYVTDAGVLMVREGGIGKRAEIKSSGREAIVKDFVPLRDALKQAHFDQLNNGEWEKSLAELQKAYRAFVKKNGQIHKHTTYMQNVKVDELDDEGNPTGRKVADQEQRYRMPTLNAIKEDPDWTLVASLESFNEETGEINESVFLTDRVLKRRAPAKVETPTDAMLQVLNDIGKIDIAETARRIGLSEQETINSLGALVYNDPSAGWVTADDYLSGDIRKKLKEARAAADTDKLYQRNVEALISALPNGNTAAEITPQIGMSWIPTSIYEQFLREKANVRATVTFNERLGKWDVEAISGHQGLEATQDWGTPRRNAADILGYALSGAPVRIMQSVGFGSNRKEDFDPVATQAVTEKLNNMREAFKTWLWEDPARVETLVPIYNEKFNSIVPRSFNGDHLTLPGVSERWMKLGVFQHVKRGAWRIIQQGNTYLAHAVGSGKAQPLDAKVLTPNGWKLMGDIIPGDVVVAADGSPTAVEAVFPQGSKEIYRVEFSDGSATECCDEHLWLTQTYRERSAAQRAARMGRHWPHGQAKIRSLAEIRKTLVSPHLGAKNHSIPMVGAVQFAARPVPLDAYVVGALLGDGGLSGNSAVLSSADQEIIDMVAAKLPNDCELVHRGKYDYTIAYRGAVRYASGGGMIPSNPVINALRDLGAFGLRSHEKSIPDLYLFNSTETRIALLQGLLDTDGWVEGAGRSLRFTTTSGKLADGVVSIVRSLGGAATRRNRLPSYTYQGVRKIGREAHELTIALPPTIEPFRLRRKAEKFIPRAKYAPVRYITNVVPVGSKPAQCILVAHKDHLYVTDDFIVTHNTNQMIISAMEQKRLGLIQKPMMVVPNHMLKQFASEWMDLYPAARLMVADEANFTGDNRRRFVARAALSDLDGVIITHSAFKLLDLDPVFKQKMIEEQLQYLRAALKEAGGTEEKTANGKSKNRDPKVKQIEKKIERWEQKLAATMSSEGKDKNVRFDEMGVDMLYVDEAHNFRKLEFTTQRQVKGIDSGGSDMASDLHMKVQWLRENKNPKRNLVMASGTPVTNTLAEIYSVQRLMAPDVLAARGLEEFDQWASMFGAESTNIEPDASGRYGPVTRFNKFVNVGELTQMFREFADVLTSDYLAATLGDKRPKVKGGSRNMIITPKTQAYTDFQRDVLQPRMKASREWKWSKDEPNNPDPIIAIIGDGRLAAIDLRFMDPKAPNDPDSKLNKMIDEVIRVYKETADREFTTDGKPGSKVEPDKGAVQMVFAELGFGAGVAANRGFNARAWFEKRLRDAGVKPEHVAFMSDNKKSSAKVKLFRDMNAGRVRIAVGTSKNMGTGVNAQQRLVALHHLDSPWFPADLEQREGRIVRQGNKHKEVELYAYAMKGSYDEQMWSTLARKQFFIDQALSGDANIREIEDLGESSQFEIAAAMVADDPRVLQLAGLRAEVERLGRLRSAHDDQRGRMQREYAAAESRLGWIERQLSGLRADAAKVQDITGDKFTAKADGKTFNTRKEWGQALMARYKDLSDHLVDKETVIGSISGFDVIYQGRMSKATTTSITTYTDGTTKTETSKRFESAIGIRASEPTILAQDVTSDPVGVAMRAQTTLAGIARAPAALESEANDLKAKRNALEPRLTAQFPMLQMLLDKMGEAAALEDAIVASGQALTGLEREQELEDAWQARTGAITPLFSRGTGAGMAAGDLKSTVDRVSRGFKNLPKVHVFASPAELSTKDPAQKALADFIRKAGAWEDVEGAMHQGEIYLFASGLADAARAEHVLATHEVTHYGLRGAIGKGLDSALHHIWLNNAAVRKEAAAIKRRNGLASNTEAVEEVLADMPAADLVKLKGWRRVVMVARDWLRNAGATNLAGRIDSWLNSTLDDQQKADLFVADLVNAARNFARNGKPASVMAGTRLADGTLAEDVAKQEKWLTAEARARGFKSIDELAEKNYPAFEKLAAKWREQNPVENALLSRASETIARRKAAIAVLGDGWKGGAGSETRDVYKKRVGGLEVSVIPQRTVDGNFYIGSYYHSGQRKGVGSMAFANTLEEAAQKANAMFGAVSPKLSRAAVVNQTNTPTAAERADAILAKPAGTWRPVDAVMRAVTQAVRIDKATGYLYDKAATLIDRYTPEQIKAGVVADYGIPEAVIDRRVEMQGRQRAQIRKAGALLEKLSTLTRAESRLAYEWMNNNDPQAAAYFEKQLSPESIAVMEEIKTMVDDLSKEAVAMGQLSPEAYKRNRFEYLHRSYAKYTAEQTNGETKGRQRAIAVLGDQYKGRGMSDAVDMAKVQNVAPEWWGRKLQAGQADKGLIGAKFVRYERRAPTGEGSGALETAQGPGNTNPQKKGKLLEVAYWPADEKAPAKYSTWDQSGTWEVRDTKGGKLIVWRDFTKAERTAMGEIDEARYAIAKTLHGMIHDVETGRYLEWIGNTYGKVKGEQINGEIVEASDRMRDTFAPGTWVQVPETKIPGTSVSKYGALAGKFIPGPIWNDVRQSVGFRFGPELWRDILGAWKTAKTALSPAVHTNNVMANFVMADWHDVSAGHIAKALRIILGASKREGKGIIGRTGNLAARAGSADAEAAREIIARFHESGANMGSWVNAELQREQIEPLLDALEAEIGLAGQHTADAQVGAFAALQKALQLRFPSAWDAFKPTAAGKALTTEVGNMLDLYEGEDQVFRLAAWLKAKEDGESDLVAGRRARRSFLDYHINAPWIQAMRNSAFPFISFTYRAVPMLLETAARKPHKLMKLAMFAGLVNAIGYLLSGGDEDDERRLLPEEKAGRVWGLVPKLVRMPWNDKFGSPVFLDIRRFVPVSDIFDTGQNHAAIPMLPFAVPGGPLAIISEVVSNKSQFTGRPITLETDTGAEKAAKLADHLYKAFAPNIVILPGTHAFTGVVNAGSGRTDSFGREQSVVQAGLTSFGVKVGSYPKDVLMLNAMRQAEGQMMEIDRQITQEKRELQRRGVSEDEFMKNVDSLIVKKQGISERLQKRLGGG